MSTVGLGRNILINNQALLKAIPYLSLDPNSENNDNALIIDEGKNAINATAYSGKCLTFDGSTSFVDTNNTLNTSHTNTIEISCWLNISYLSSNNVIISNRVNSGDKKGLTITILTDGTIEFILRDNNFTLIQEASTSSITLNNWHFISVIYNPTTDEISFFIDNLNAGVISINTGVLTDTTSSGNLEFGSLFQSFSFLDGKLSNPKITINGQVVRDYPVLKGIDSSDLWFDRGSDKAHATVNNCVVETGLSGYNYPVAVSQALKDHAGVYLTSIDTQRNFGSIAADPSFNDLGTNSFKIRYRFWGVYTAAGNNPNIYTAWDQNSAGWRLRVNNRSLNFMISDGVGNFIEVSVGSVENRYADALFEVDRASNTMSATLNGQLINTIDISSVGSITDLSKNLTLGNRIWGVPQSLDILNGDDTVRRSFDFRTIDQEPDATISANIPRQQFPETGIPQTINEECNGYEIISTSYTGYSIDQQTYTGDFDIEFQLYIKSIPNTGVFLVHQNDSLVAFRIDSDGTVKFASGGTFSFTPKYTIGTVDTVRYQRVGNQMTVTTANGSETKTVTTNTISFNHIGFPNTTWGADMIFFKVFNNDVKIFSGVTNGGDINIPEDLSNLGSDISGNAIQNSIKDSSGNQVLWNFDGESWIDTNWVRTLDRDKPFSVLFAETYFDNGEFQILVDNLDHNSNAEGISIYYLDFSDKTRFYLKDVNGNIIGNVVDIVIPENDNSILMYTWAGGNLPSDNKCFVNGVESSLTTLSASLDSEIISSNSILIGKRPNTDIYLLEGQLSRIQFFEKDLSSKATKKYQALFDELNYTPEYELDIFS